MSITVNITIENLMSNIKIGDKLLGGELEVIDIQGNLILCMSKTGSPSYYGMKDGSCLSDERMVNIGNHMIKFELTGNNYNYDRLLRILEEACRDHPKILDVSVSSQSLGLKIGEIMADDSFKFSILPDGSGLGIWFKTIINFSDGEIEREILYDSRYIKDGEILNIKLSDPSPTYMIMNHLKKSGFL